VEEENVEEEIRAEKKGHRCIRDCSETHITKIHGIKE
jgi:hypothetical protein